MNWSAITRGEAVACRSLLHNCRFEGMGTEAFGGDAIAELFREAPLAWTGETVVVDNPRFTAAFGYTTRGPIALFADVQEGHVTRMWLLGDDDAGDPAPIVTAVPADPILSQCAPRLALAATEHPALDADHVAAIECFGQTLINGEQPFPTPATPHARVRPVVLRAISSGDRTAVLMHVRSLRHRERGGISHAYAATLLGPDERFVPDLAGLRRSERAEWRPRV